VGVFAYCYGRIFHTVRRQSKIIGGQAGRSQNIAMTTTSRDQNAGQIHQQATGATSGAKLSRTELNVIKTMIIIIALFLTFWCTTSFSNLLFLLGVSLVISKTQSHSVSIIIRRSELKASDKI